MTTREDWLMQASKLIETQILSPQGASMPEKYDIGVGFPSVTKAIGQAWSKDASVDENTYHILIAPTLGNKDIINMLQVLLHEMIHCSVGIDQKHGGEFKRVARAVGLEGRLTATYVSEGSDLYNQLKSVSEQVGWEYPHQEIVLKPKETKPRAKNFVQLVSPNNPEYIVKMKKDIYEAMGAPVDPEGDEMEILEEE